MRQIARMRHLFAALSLLSTLLVAGTAGAAPTEDERREASKLAGEALDLFRSGDFANALDRFRKAEALVPTPPLGVMIARCLDELDRMHEAADAYREVIAAEIPSDAPEVHKKAREDAVSELAEVLKQTPRLTIELSGGSVESVVSIDGEQLDDWRRERSLDPGRHVVAARHGDATVREVVVLERGQRRNLVLRSGPHDPPPDPTPPPRPQPLPDTPDQGLSPWSIAGWSWFSVGIAGGIVWGVAGGIGLSRQADLEEACTDGRCPPTAQDDVDAYDVTKGVATAGFVVGVAGIGIAIPLLVVGAVADAPDEAGTSWAPVLGPGTAGMMVRSTF